MNAHFYKWKDTFTITPSLVVGKYYDYDQRRDRFVIMFDWLIFSIQFDF